MKEYIDLLQSYNADFSPDGEKCISSGTYLNLWSIKEKKKIWKCHPLSNISYCVFSNNGKMISVKNTSGEIKSIFTENGEVNNQFQSQIIGEGSNIIWLGNDEYLLDGSWSGFLTLRDTKNGNIVWYKQFKNEMICNIFTNRLKTSFITRNKPTINSDKKTSYGSYFIIWNLPFSESSGVVFEIKLNAIHEVSFNSDLSKCAIVHSRNPFTLSLFDLKSKSVLWSRDTNNSGTGFCLSWINEDKVISIYNENRIQFLDSFNGNIITGYELPYACSVKESKNYLALCSWEKGRLIATPKILSTFLQLRQPESAH